jgi:mono/diheme cytochrome c family protein
LRYLASALPAEIHVVKKVLKGIGIVVLVVLLGVAGFVFFQASAFDASMNKAYAFDSVSITASADPQVIAHGRHLAEVGGCFGCHGDDLGGKQGEPFGPLGVVHASNLTRGKGGVGNRYSDTQLGRVIRHGIKADGRSLRFMPAQEFSWWPDDDLAAVVSYVRSMPPIDRALPPSAIGLLGKVLDRLDLLTLDVARRVDHTMKHPKVLEPQPTAEYGAHLGLSCKGCHGEGFSGGPIPGAPSDLPTPANITPHETGIKRYTEADFMRLLDTGIKANGKPLDPFMPIAILRAMNPTERKALWAYLQSLPPKPFGGR